MFFSGFMHAHISYLAEDCQACLVLLTVDHNLFFSLSDAKRKITEVGYIKLILVRLVENITNYFSFIENAAQ